MPLRMPISARISLQQLLCAIRTCFKTRLLKTLKEARFILGLHDETQTRFFIRILIFSYIVNIVIKTVEIRNF